MAKAATKAKQPEVTTITLPELANGEVYAGIILENGKPSHHLILLPGEAERVTWSQAKEWATKQGGELPSRREQSLLFANAKDEFNPEWYWSAEHPSVSSVYAWFQFFTNGYQTWGHKRSNYRARAVRRSVIQSFDPS